MVRQSFFLRFLSSVVISLIFTICSSSLVLACDQSLEVVSVNAGIEQIGHPAEQALDGDLSTRWSGYGVGTEFILDLGSKKNIECVNIAWYRGNTRQNNFLITALDDNLNDSDVLFNGKSSGNTDNFETYRFDSTQARYLKITVNGNTTNDWASISEIGLMTSESGFRHPGVLVTKEQLDYVESKIKSYEAPWPHRLMGSFCSCPLLGS